MRVNIDEYDIDIADHTQDYKQYKIDKYVAKRRLNGIDSL
jgi:hypothetical protein